MSAYSEKVDSLRQVQDAEDADDQRPETTVMAADHNEQTQALQLLVAALGPEVQGGFSTLQARLAAIEQGLADLGAVINPSPSTELWVADFSQDGAPPDPPWTVHSGTWQFVSNQLDNTDAAGSPAELTRDTGQVDHRITSDVRIGLDDGFAAHVFGIVCAFVDDDNYVGWEIVLGNAGAGEENKIVLYVKTGGSDSEKVTVPGAFDFQGEHELSLRRFGNVILAWLDGDQIASYTLSGAEQSALAGGTEVGAVQFMGRSSWLSMRATAS